MSTWNEDFPIKQSQEHQASRREFTKFLGIGVSGFCSAKVLEDHLFPGHVPKEAAPMKVAESGELQPGDSKLFRYPTKHDPAILVRLTDGSYRAYDQRCTHLLCPVHFNSEKQSMYCPCHHGSFDAQDGSVQYGPPQQPLPQYTVLEKEGQLWVESKGA